MGCLISVLPSEGTVSQKNIPAFFYKNDIDIGKTVDMEMVWGSEWKKIFLKNTTLKDKQIHIVGCPRFDIYRYPLNQLLMSKEDFCQKYRIDSKKKLVIWTSNFVNPERSKEDLKYVQSFVPYDIKKRIKIEKNLRKICVEYFYKLIKENPEINFMIKLHPLEIDNYYIKQLSKLKKGSYSLIKDEDIANIVNACDLLIHTGSTSATEAGFLNKPTICMIFEPEFEEYLAEFNWGSDIVKDYKSLQEKINYYLYERGKISKKILEKRKNHNEEWYYKIDGKSTFRAANAIDLYLKNVDIPDINRRTTTYFSDELINKNPFTIFTINILNKILNRNSYWNEIRKTQIPTRKELKNIEVKLIKLL